MKKYIKEKSRFKCGPKHQTPFTNTLVLSLRNKIEGNFTHNIENEW